MFLKDPSWSQLVPSLPFKTTMRARDSEKLLALLDRDGRLYHACFEEIMTENYILEDKQGELFFIKKLPKSARNDVMEAESIAYFLKQSNLDVNCYCDFVECDHSMLLVYPYIDGQRIRPENQKVMRVAKIIAKLHESLQQHPSCDQWKVNTKQRYQNLEKVRKNLCLSKYSKCPFNISGSIVRLANEFSFSDIACDGSPMHGDLNLGNMMSIGSKIFLFDFEDVVHSCHSPIMELGYCIERLILSQANFDVALSLGKIFLESYLQAGGTYSFRISDQYVLKLLVLRSFCTILYMMECGVLVSTAEWDKFLYLHKRSHSHHEIFYNIISSFK